VHELRAWLENHGFAIVSEDILDFGVSLTLRPPAGKTMRIIFRPDTEADQVIDMIRMMYAHRLEKLN
jgi:hypothetical protein